MASDLAAWFEAAIGQAKQEGTWQGMGALATRSGVARQALYDIRKGRQVSQEKVRAIAEAMGVPVPRVGAIVSPAGASALALASLAAARSDLQAAIRRIDLAERELTGGGSDGALAGGAVRRKKAADSGLQPPATRRGVGGK